MACEPVAESANDASQHRRFRAPADAQSAGEDHLGSWRMGQHGGSNTVAGAASAPGTSEPLYGNKDRSAQCGIEFTARRRRDGQPQTGVVETLSGLSGSLRDWIRSALSNAGEST